MNEFWIVNITKTDIHLSDLDVIIRAGHTVNLFDKRRFRVTEDQVLKSYENGSLKKREGKIIKRASQPVREKKIYFETTQTCLIKQKRSIIKIEETKYEELDMPDEVYADQITNVVSNTKG